MPHENIGNYIDNEVQPEEIDEMQPGENGHENSDLKRSTRSRRAPDYLRDYHHQISNSMRSRTENVQVRYPINFVFS